MAAARAESRSRTEFVAALSAEALSPRHASPVNSQIPPRRTRSRSVPLPAYNCHTYRTSAISPEPDLIYVYSDVIHVPLSSETLVSLPPRGQLRSPVMADRPGWRSADSRAKAAPHRSQAASAWPRNRVLETAYPARKRRVAASSAAATCFWKRAEVSRAASVEFLMLPHSMSTSGTRVRLSPARLSRRVRPSTPS